MLMFYTENQVKAMLQAALQVGYKLPGETCRVSVAGLYHKLGPEALYVGQKVVLIKEPENDYDDDAILVAIGLDMNGKAITGGYVANSPKTVEPGTLSASEIQPYFDEQTTGVVCEFLRPHWIVEFTPNIDLEGMIEKIMEENS